MNTSEILKRIDIPRAKLYYLEEKGYIHPEKIIKGNRNFNQYNKEDFERIQTIWQFVKNGLSYQAAYKKALDVIDDR